MGICTVAYNREAWLELLKPSRRWCAIIALIESGITSSVLRRVRRMFFHQSEQVFRRSLSAGAPPGVISI